MIVCALNLVFPLEKNTHLVRVGQALQRLKRQWQEQPFSLQTRQFKMTKETPRPCQGHSTRSICTANGTMSILFIAHTKTD